MADFVFYNSPKFLNGSTTASFKDSGQPLSRSMLIPYNVVEQYKKWAAAGRPQDAMTNLLALGSS